MIELVEMEVGEMLESQGFEGTPFVRGSALRALDGADTDCIEALLKAMDDHFAVPERDKMAPFQMPIEDTFSITGRGTVVTGTLWQGTIRPGDRMRVEPPGVDARVRNVGAAPLGLEALVLGFRWRPPAARATPPRRA